MAAVRLRRRQGDLPHLYKSAQNTSADHVNARCSLHQTGRMPRERRLAFRSMKIWPVSPRNITLHATTKDVGEHISSAHEEDKANNRKPIMKLLSTPTSSPDKAYFPPHLRTEDNPARSTWLVDKYAWQMHNEMLKVMTQEVLRDVAASLQYASDGCKRTVLW